MYLKQRYDLLTVSFALSFDISPWIPASLWLWWCDPVTDLMILGVNLSIIIHCHSVSANFSAGLGPGQKLHCYRRLSLFSTNCHFLVCFRWPDKKWFIFYIGHWAQVWENQMVIIDILWPGGAVMIMGSRSVMNKPVLYTCMYRWSWVELLCRECLSRYAM